MAAPTSGDEKRRPPVLQQLRDPVVRGIGYDDANLRLVLAFRNGPTVEYLAVPREIYDAFIQTQPRSWAAAGSLLRRYRQHEIPPLPISG